MHCENVPWLSDKWKKLHDFPEAKGFSNWLSSLALVHGISRAQFHSPARCKISEQHEICLEDLVKPKRRTLQPNFSFFTSLSTPEAHVRGVKFIGLYAAVGFITIRDFSFWDESDLWSDVWPAIDEAVCLSLLLEGERTISNNFTKQRQNGFKLGTRDKCATHLR